MAGKNEDMPGYSNRKDSTGKIPSSVQVGREGEKREFEETEDVVAKNSASKRQRTRVSTDREAAGENCSKPSKERDALKRKAGGNPENTLDDEHGNGTTVNGQSSPTNRARLLRTLTIKATLRLQKGYPLKLRSEIHQLRSRMPPRRPSRSRLTNTTKKSRSPLIFSRFPGMTENS